jgi:hypothetical protein
MPWCEVIEPEKVEEPDPNLTPIDYLLIRMRDPRTEEGVKTRIAIALLPFTAPKLAVTATIEGKDFASLLDRAVARSAQVRDAIAQVQEAKVEPEPVTAQPILPPVPDKRYRR